MKVKTSELTRHALNWAVSLAEGGKVFRPRLGRPDDWDRHNPKDDRWVVRVQNPTLAYFVDWTYDPCSSWREGGPIIDREDIDVLRDTETVFGAKLARTAKHPQRDVLSYFVQRGPTKLTAAMRCYVASKLGDEVEIPDELLKEQP